MPITPPTIHFNLDSDVRAVSEMAAGVVPYIYETELYGPMPPTLPRLTMGGLLMRLHRLNAISALLSPAQQTKLAEAQAIFDKMRTEWAVAYEGKLDREIDARLKALGNLVNECKDEQRRCIESYASEIEKRVMLEHLIAEAKARNTLKDAQKAGVAGFDASMRAYLEHSDFIWDARLKPAYPAERFSYLYMQAAQPGGDAKIVTS